MMVRPRHHHHPPFSSSSSSASLPLLFLLFLLIFISIPSALSNPVAVPGGTGNGQYQQAQQQQQHYSKYHQHGYDNGNMDYFQQPENKNNRRMQYQQHQTNRRLSSAADGGGGYPLGLRPVEPPSPERMIFADLAICRSRCEILCESVYAFRDPDKEAVDQPVHYFCHQLKKEEPFHARVAQHLSNASWFQFAIFGVVFLAVMLCLICGCYQCCCRASPSDGRPGSPFTEEQCNPMGMANNNHHGGKPMAMGIPGTREAEREALTNGGSATGQHIDGVIHPTPLVVKNGGAVQQFRQQHPGGPGATFVGGGSREQSII